MAPRFAQKRAQETYEALLRAAARVFAERGYDGTQTPDIAREAGVSTGAFYRYFTDKREALLEVLRRHLDEGRARVDAELRPERFAGADAAKTIGLVLDILFERVRSNAGIVRVYATMSLTDPEVAKLRASAEAVDRATLAHILAAVVPRAVVPNPQAAAAVIQMAALEVAAERAGLRPHEGTALADDDVKEALAEMLRRYLFPQAPPARPAKRVRRGTEK